MAIPGNATPTTCVIYNGWGGAIRTSDVPCRLTEQLDEGRDPGTSSINWTHFIDLDTSFDIRDGITRAAGANELTYADGDEVRIPDADGTKFVVVFVVMMGYGTQYGYKRAYLMRDAPVFDGTGWS